jgi:hypothetical protein
MKDTVKVGDKVTISGHPRRDGKAQVLLLGVELADGRKVSVRPE